VPSREICDRFQMLTHVSSATTTYDWTLRKVEIVKCMREIYKCKKKLIFD
jgi:hypothetical protein